MASLSNGKLVYEEAAAGDADDVPDDATVQLSLMTLRRANLQLQKRCQLLERR